MPILLDACPALCYNFKLRGIRAVTQGTARQVYLACDADPALTEPLLALCREKGVSADCSLTMQQLGRACGIAVAAAAVAIVAQ